MERDALGIGDPFYKFVGPPQNRVCKTKVDGHSLKIVNPWNK